MKFAAIETYRNHVACTPETGRQQPLRCNAFDHCNCSRKRPEAFTLVLRRWHSLHESSEFRVFVRDDHLIAISQRQTSGFFEHLLQEEDTEYCCVFHDSHLRPMCISILLLAVATCLTCSTVVAVLVVVYSWI